MIRGVRRFGINVCPRDKPHLQKLWPGFWWQSWPDGWRQYIAVWGDRCPRALPRYPAGSRP